MSTINQTCIRAGLFTVCFAVSSVANGHGTPIHVDVVANKLTVSGGVPDPAGFAPMIFAEDDEDGDPFGEVNLPGFGQATIWQIPGFEIVGMNEQSGLFLDVMSRPYAFALPVEQRALWYWNPQTQRVGTTPEANPLQIRKSSAQNVTLLPTSGADPPPLQIAEPLSSEMGFHNHLVAYALSNEAAAPAGAYGFFARLTSNQYAASDPFLVVLNNGVDYSQMVPAALAINAAAFLPGDYNHNDRVDAADYVIWRKTLGSTTMLAADGSNNQVVDHADYAVWRQDYGTTIGSGGLSNTEIPEPSGCVLCIMGVFGGVWLGTLRGSRGFQKDRSAEVSSRGNSGRGWFDRGRHCWN